MAVNSTPLSDYRNYERLHTNDKLKKCSFVNTKSHSAVDRSKAVGLVFFLFCTTVRHLRKLMRYGTYHTGDQRRLR